MIEYLNSVEGISPIALTGFFVGWPNPPSPEAHLKILNGSSAIVLARDTETGQVVGFITAVSDGVLSAYIPLLEVLPTYQKQGIGRELVERMLKKLEDLYMIDLFCDSELRSFYEKFGMHAGNGMMLRNYENQAGKEG